jgi:hypothetical protein
MDAKHGTDWPIPTIRVPGEVKVKADTRTCPKLKDFWTSPALQKISAPAKGHRHFLALWGMRGEPKDLADMVREARKSGVNTFVALIRRFRVYHCDTSSLGMTGIDLKMSKASSALLFAEPETNDRRQP